MAGSMKKVKHPPVSAPAPFRGEGSYIFISYKREDLPRITSCLHHIVNSGHNIWYDKGIPGGAIWSSLIQEKVSDCDLLLVFISREAVESKWLRREVHVADKQNKPILAIQLEETELKYGLGMILEPNQIISAANVDFSKELTSAINQLRQQKRSWQANEADTIEEKADHPDPEYAKGRLIQAAEKATEVISVILNFFASGRRKNRTDHLRPGKASTAARLLCLFCIQALFAVLTIQRFVPSLFHSVWESALCGVALGSAQALVLRRFLPSAVRWILFTAAGAFVAGLFCDHYRVSWDLAWSYATRYPNEFRYQFINPAATIMTFVTLHWSLVGFTQWLLLRKLTGAAWPIATGAGAVAYGLIMIAFFQRLPGYGFFLLYIVCAGLLLGVPQGLCLIYSKKRSGP